MAHWMDELRADKSTPIWVLDFAQQIDDRELDPVTGQPFGAGPAPAGSRSAPEPSGCSQKNILRNARYGR